MKQLKEKHMTETKQKYQPLTKDRTEMFLKCVLLEHKDKEWTPPTDEKWPALSRIVQLRINVMKLPISFTSAALMSVNCLCDRPGAAVLLLIDALDKYEGQKVDMKMMADLYPIGFYTEEAFIERIDKEIKEGKGKWDYVYQPC